MSSSIEELNKIGISARSQVLVKRLLEENDRLAQIVRSSMSPGEVVERMGQWMDEYVSTRPRLARLLEPDANLFEGLHELSWSDMAAVRIIDYLNNDGRIFEDNNRHGQPVVSSPFGILWLAVHRGTGGAKSAFFNDMRELFAQFSGQKKRVLPDEELIRTWMKRHPSGLDEAVVSLRAENKARIADVIAGWILKGRGNDRFSFPAGATASQRRAMVFSWWNDYVFHLRFAAKTPEELNQLLGGALDHETMALLGKAKARGLPFFVNPHYASLINVRTPDFAIGSDLPIRDYVIYSRELVEEFGQIHAWEKEDQVVPGRPNAAGWILPDGGNVHRRYPDSAILIPNTNGRACGGLCTTCQRMYHFQKGRNHFETERLLPRKTWNDRLEMLMNYFGQDSQIKDILITGGDALMSTDKSLTRIFEAILKMAQKRLQENETLPAGQKRAPLVRIRMGTRLLGYIPQRVTPALCEVLASFREKAEELGICQFVIQTHFESAMEITPASAQAIAMLQNSGWMVANQHVMTSSSSRRGHICRLRQQLLELGVYPYYTFSVKGFKENAYLFATTARTMQERIEEKSLGLMDQSLQRAVMETARDPVKSGKRLQELMIASGKPFFATDRNITNLPAVGKSLAFRVIGITRFGERIMQFDHDRYRPHSPIIQKMGKVEFVESKTIDDYLAHIAQMGEDPAEYDSIYGYSIGQTESRFGLFDYPAPIDGVTTEFTNLQID